MPLAAASLMFGVAACAGEDEPDIQPLDAAPDVRRDVSMDTAQPDRQEGGVPEASSCLGASDAALDDALVAAGRALVESLRCANCHQEQPLDAGLILSGRLTTLVADAAVYPRNLTPDPQSGLGCWTDPQIANAILNGIDRADRELCRMPKFAARIDAGGAEQIAAFLRSLPAVQRNIPMTMPVCPGTVPPPPDARADVGPDGDGGDGSAPDGGFPDTGISSPPGDGGPDGATPDAGTDAPAPDTGADSPPTDGDLDVIGDVVSGDV